MDEVIWWACGMPGSRDRQDWWPCATAPPIGLFDEGWQVFLGSERELAALTHGPQKAGGERMTQLQLFPAAEMPRWWTPFDSMVVTDYAFWQAEAPFDTRFPDAGDPDDPVFSDALEAYCQQIHPLCHEYTCRRCRFWQSEDGVRGECGVEESESTLNCGRTRGESCCEQWEPREVHLKARC